MVYPTLFIYRSTLPLKRSSSYGGWCVARSLCDSQKYLSRFFGKDLNKSVSITLLNCPGSLACSLAHCIRFSLGRYTSLRRRYQQFIEARDIGSLTRVGIIGPWQHCRTRRLTSVSNQLDAFASSTHLSVHYRGTLNSWTRN